MSRVINFKHVADRWRNSRWEFLRKLSTVYRAYGLISRLEDTSEVSSEEAIGFNARSRDEWVIDRARSIAPGSRVLDVGAGTAPYKGLFDHCEYFTQDFAQYEGYKGAEGQYARIDYVSDIADIPVSDASFDVVLCTEVLEHVPRPIDALREMARVTKPNGRLLLTAPLGSGLHQEPYHFYGGYTDHWYRKFLNEFGCDVVTIEPNHGFFAHLGQECARFSWQFDRLKLEYGGYEEELSRMMRDLLPRYLYKLDRKILLKEFTIGFHVEATRRADNALPSSTLNVQG